MNGKQKALAAGLLAQAPYGAQANGIDHMDPANLGNTDTFVRRTTGATNTSPDLFQGIDGPNDDLSVNNWPELDAGKVNFFPGVLTHDSCGAFHHDVIPAPEFASLALLGLSALGFARKRRVA